MDFFTSDTHFSHANIIRYSNRPFSSIEEMNCELLENINSKVDINDTLYHLGDFAMGGKHQPKLMRDQIRCKNIILIRGNHDSRRPEFKALFSAVYDVYEYHNQKKAIFLSHYAHRVWDKSHHGYMHLYGHSHGSLLDDPNSLSFDVGVDCHNYQPLSFDEVLEVMSRKNWKPVDHHNPETH